MKKVLFFLSIILFTVCFVACQQEEAEALLNESDPVENLEDLGTRAVIPGTLPVYRYHKTFSSNSEDIYYTRTAPSGPTFYVKGEYYYFQYDEFAISSSYSYSKYLIPIYRYSNTKGKHRLSTASTPSGYTNREDIVAYAFTSPKFGTIPLNEYYITTKDYYLYTGLKKEEKWLANTYPGNYRHERTLGWVYPSREDLLESRQDSYITIVPDRYSKTVVGSLSVHAKEFASDGRDLTRILNYNVNVTYPSKQTITIPKQYYITSVGYYGEVGGSKNCKYGDLMDPDYTYSGKEYYFETNHTGTNTLTLQATVPDTPTGNQ